MPTEMSALTQDFANRFGDAVQRLESTDDRRTTTPTIELRQIAGLTAGEGIRLAKGTYTFGSSDGSVEGFELSVSDALDGTLAVTVVTADPTVRVDGTSVSPNRSAVDDRAMQALQPGQIIDAGTAHFRWVGQQRSIDRSMPTAAMSGSSAALANGLRVTVPGGPENEPVATRPRRIAGRLPWSRSSTPDPFTTELGVAIKKVRNSTLDRRWEAHPDPGTLIDWVRRSQPGVWARRPDHWHFGHAVIGVGTVPWQPHFDRPDAVSPEVSRSLANLHCLPSAPISTDLRSGALGIVGSRPARLAVARSIMVTLAVLSSPDDLELAILADGTAGPDWTWADALPHSGRPTTNRSGWRTVPVLVVDGLHHLDHAGIGIELSESGGVGTVLLAEHEAELPPICATVMTIDDQGLAVITDHRSSTTTVATPIGLTTELAAGTAHALGLRAQRTPLSSTS